MANAATPHPILNPTSSGTPGVSPRPSGPSLSPTRPATLSDQLAAYNISTQTVVGAVAPKVIGAAIIWIGQRIFSNLFKK